MTRSDATFVSLGDGVQVAGMTMETIEILCNGERRCNVFDGETINVESIVVEDWLGHWYPGSSRSMSTGSRASYDSPNQ
ncbi:hypothetical protein [Novipirellula aureliae]|uniref:hypothetical protein n=1 Tax=Novipirellula aureliae TaxID=2527966 RepID=UPI001E54E97C|nr:hypothetical protein [Novipirellula aureliae]